MVLMMCTRSGDPLNYWYDEVSVVVTCTLYLLHNTDNTVELKIIFTKHLFDYYSGM